MTPEQTLDAGHQLSAAVSAMGDRRGWDKAEQLGVTLAALTSMAERLLGPTGAAQLLRDHADACSRANLSAKLAPRVDF